MKSNHQIEILFQKYVHNECTEEELEELMDYLRSGEQETFIKNMLEEYIGDSRVDGLLFRAQAERVFNRLSLTQQAPAQTLIPPRRTWGMVKKMIAAAAVPAILLTIYWLMPASEKQPSPSSVVEDVLPGRNKATLVLADGQQLELGDWQAGKTTKNNETIVQDDPDTEFAHLPETNHKLTGLNTVKTPKGGQYRVLLPDGSKVWLNAASSITYPAAFNTVERRVVLTGEAYFEVTSKLKGGKKIPFIVETARQKIEVLGTRFNVNAYDEDAVTKTTLVEGKVKVVTENETVILKPSQEFNLKPEGISTRKVDVEPAIDWKNGDFIFADENLRSIMRKLARWYNVEIEYDSELPEELLSGQISRNRNLSEVLRMLELSGDTKFTIEKNKIHISYQKK